MMRRLLLVSLLAIASAFAAGCRGDDDAGSNVGDPGTQPPAPASSTTTATDPIAAFESLEIPTGLADGHALGDPDAPVTLALFEDFQCPFCLAFTLRFEEIIVRNYVETGKVRLEFKHFPILGQESVDAARASVCTAAQNVFWPMHNRLFLEQAQAGQLTDEKLNVGRFAVDRLRAFAIDAGAEAGAWDACMSEEALVTVQAHFAEARSLGLRGTPGVVLNGQPVAIPRDEPSLRALLDEAVAAAE
jgi:protein-disulfide isomerase